MVLLIYLGLVPLFTNIRRYNLLMKLNQATPSAHYYPTSWLKNNELSLASLYNRQYSMSHVLNQDDGICVIECVVS